MKFSIKDFFSKCAQSGSFFQIWYHLLKKSWMEDFSFCTVEIFRLKGGETDKTEQSIALNMQNNKPISINVKKKLHTIWNVLKSKILILSFEYK